MNEIETADSQRVFPMECPGDSHRFPHACGLTKRELFAAMAMQGMLAAAEVMSPAMTKIGKEDGVGPTAMYSRVAVEHADALIAALKEKP